jgi:hypothetical protein
LGQRQCTILICFNCSTGRLYDRNSRNYFCCFVNHFIVRLSALIYSQTTLCAKSFVSRQCSRTIYRGVYQGLDLGKILLGWIVLLIPHWTLVELSMSLRIYTNRSSWLKNMHIQDHAFDHRVVSWSSHHLTLLSKASTRLRKAATMSRMRLILLNSASSSSICLSRSWTRAISAFAASIEETALELCLCTDACVWRVNSRTQFCQ